jgi:hypothetical protein
VEAASTRRLTTSIVSADPVFERYGLVRVW